MCLKTRMFWFGWKNKVLFYQIFTMCLKHWYFWDLEVNVCPKLLKTLYARTFWKFWFVGFIIENHFIVFFFNGEFYTLFAGAYFPSKIKICCFSIRNFFFKKSNLKCIRGQEKLILNTFMHEATFFMIWWQQAHFFMVFQFFSTLACTAIEGISCIIKA